MMPRTLLHYEWLRISCTTNCIRIDKLPKRDMSSPHVTNKMPTATNGYHRPGKIKHFLKSCNQEMPIRIPYKFHLFLSYDCHCFLIMSKLKVISEVYLEPSQTSTMELFCENS